MLTTARDGEEHKTSGSLAWTRMIGGGFRGPATASSWLPSSVECLLGPSSGMEKQKSRIK